MRRILAVLFTVAPFVAATIAALGVRHDLRMVWMALVATVVARMVFVFARARVATPSATIASLVAATLVSSVVALLFGARAAFGIIAVAVVLSGCAALGAALGGRRTP
ncbi:MAG: hypothetical protein ACJ79A_02210 [Gemmatimonadaceae bacterium]